jgi:uncharacterized paraquat-inducible protein A
MNCDRDCHNCPFVIDPHDSDHYVCIKCGREYSFRRPNLIHPLGLIVLTIIVIAVLEQSPTTRNNRRNTQETSQVEVLPVLLTGPLV